MGVGELLMRGGLEISGWELAGLSGGFGLIGLLGLLGFRVQGFTVLRVIRSLINNTPAPNPSCLQLDALDGLGFRSYP